jgi:hypothetical protein
MTQAAPRIDERLVAAIERVQDPRRPIADTHRLVGEIAEKLGMIRPSYEQVRTLVHVLRTGKRDTSIGQVLLDIAFRARAPEELLRVRSD